MSPDEVQRRHRVVAAAVQNPPAWRQRVPTEPFAGLAMPSYSTPLAARSVRRAANGGPPPALLERSGFDLVRHEGTATPSALTSAVPSGT